MKQSQTQAPRCAWCSKEIALTPGRGRKRKYCSDACKQRAYEARSGVVPRARPSAVEDMTAGQESAFRDQLFELRCAAEDISTAVAEGADAAEIESLCSELVTMAKKLERVR